MAVSDSTGSYVAALIALAATKNFAKFCVDVRTVATGECHTPIELSLELAAPLREEVRG